MSVNAMEKTNAQPVNRTPSQPAALAKATAKNVELLANLDEYSYASNVIAVLNANADALDLSAAMPVVMTAKVDFFTDFPMVGKLHECRGPTPKDDLGRQSGRYANYEVYDLMDAVKLISAVFATRGLNLSTEGFDESKNVRFCLNDKPCSVKITSYWQYANSKDQVGHFGKIISVEVVDKSFPAGHPVKKFARFVDGLNAKLRAL